MKRTRIGTVAITMLAMLALSISQLSCAMQEMARAQMDTLYRSQPLEGEKSLEARIRFGIGTLEVSSEQNESLYTLDLQYDRANYRPTIDYRAGEGGGSGELFFELQNTGKIGIRADPTRNRLRLGFAETVPLRLRVDTGVGGSVLSLSRVKLEHLDLKTGVGDARITAFEPNRAICERIRIQNGVGSMSSIGLGNLNFRNFEFEGGVGGAALDFTGEWKRDAEIKIRIGVGGVSLKMPREIGVVVDAEKNFLGGIHLDGFVERDSLHYSTNYEEAKYRVSLQVATGFGGFKISWV